MKICTNIVKKKWLRNRQKLHHYTKMKKNIKNLKNRAIVRNTVYKDTVKTFSILQISWEIVVSILLVSFITIQNINNYWFNMCIIWECFILSRYIWTIGSNWMDKGCFINEHYSYINRNAVTIHRTDYLSLSSRAISINFQSREAEIIQIMIR